MISDEYSTPMHEERIFRCASPRPNNKIKMELLGVLTYKHKNSPKTTNTVELQISAVSQKPYANKQKHACANSVPGAEISVISVVRKPTHRKEREHSTVMAGSFNNRAQPNYSLPQHPLNTLKHARTHAGTGAHLLHLRVVAHDPIEVVWVEVIHPEFQGAQSQPVEVTSAPQRVHHEPHHQGQVGQERRKPGRHGKAELHENVLYGHILRAVVQLAQLGQEQRKKRVYFLF